MFKFFSFDTQHGHDLHHVDWLHTKFNRVLLSVSLILHFDVDICNVDVALEYSFTFVGIQGNLR